WVLARDHSRLVRVLQTVLKVFASAKTSIITAMHKDRSHVFVREAYSTLNNLTATGIPYEMVYNSFIIDFAFIHFQIPAVRSAAPTYNFDRLPRLLLISCNSLRFFI
ncbi:hypothetical protein PROFUN_16773, partial [Planoprotostelium fungivorum]